MIKRLTEVLAKSEHECKEGKTTATTTKRVNNIGRTFERNWLTMYGYPLLDEKQRK